MILEYRADNFAASQGSLLQGPGSISCTWSDLIWAAVTVGRANWAQVFKHGWYSQLECVYRAAMFWANLKQTSANTHQSHILKTPAFSALDPSEKTAIPYYFGLAVTKLLAAKLLSAPWPQHLDTFSGFLSPNLVRAERPDLVAKNTKGKWLSLEAKGRSNGLESACMTKAKTQLKRLKKINGKRVYLRVAVGCYFLNDILRARIIDPTDEARQPVNLDVPDEFFIRSYYDTLARSCCITLDKSLK